jgi:hypothetical protein
MSLLILKNLVKCCKVSRQFSVLRIQCNESFLGASPALRAGDRAIRSNSPPPAGAGNSASIPCAGEKRLPCRFSPFGVAALHAATPRLDTAKPKDAASVRPLPGIPSPRQGRRVGEGRAGRRQGCRLFYPPVFAEQKLPVTGGMDALGGEPQAAPAGRPARAFLRARDRRGAEQTRRGAAGPEAKPEPRIARFFASAKNAPKGTSIRTVG